MHLSAEQHTFFDLFGYLVIPGALTSEIREIDEAFEELVATSGWKPVPFIDQSARLCGLLDHPLIVGIAEDLLGERFNYMSSDGGLKRDPETAWHSDGDWLHQRDLRKLKMLVYLDVLDGNSGCLRVIPGSHRVGEGFAEEIERIACLAMRDGTARPLGIPGSQWPSQALATRPGDLIVFNHHLKHAAYHGGIRRRLFSLNLCEHAHSEVQIDQLRKYLLMHNAGWGDQVYGERMLRDAGAQRLTHLQQVLEHQHVIAESRVTDSRAATVPP